MVRYLGLEVLYSRVYRGTICRALSAAYERSVCGLFVQDLQRVNVGFPHCVRWVFQRV